jgi:hypothetical protein
MDVTQISASFTKVVRVTSVEVSETAIPETSPLTVISQASEQGKEER